jgi:hypothetical protein
MRLLLRAIVLLATPASAVAFTPSTSTSSAFHQQRTTANLSSNNRMDFFRSHATSTDNADDCGCATAPTIYSGKPSTYAQSINPRQLLRENNNNKPMYNVDGEEVFINTLLDQNKVSIVVFLRSLG